MIPQILQRLIPINDASQCTICQDYPEQESVKEVCVRKEENLEEPRERERKRKKTTTDETGSRKQRVYRLIVIMHLMQAEGNDSISPSAPGGCF